MATYPVVTASTQVRSENCVFWAVTNSAATLGALVIFDTRTNEWYTDTASAHKTLATWGGQLVVDGRKFQTPTVWYDATDGVASAAITWGFDTGDWRPFGPAGWGRLRLYGLLGESASWHTTTFSVSYDSGQNWTDSYSWAVEPTAAGDEWLAYAGPSRIQGCTYRLRVASVNNSGLTHSIGAGLALNSISAEVYPATGLRRLAAAQGG
jgi:hypothetical protein